MGYDLDLAMSDGDTNAARSALTRAKTHPACTAEWAPTIDAKLEQLGGVETPWA